MEKEDTYRGRAAGLGPDAQTLRNLSRESQRDTIRLTALGMKPHI